MNLFFQKSGQTRLVLNRDWQLLHFNQCISDVFLSLYHQKLYNGISIKGYIDIPLLSFFADSYQLALEGEEIHRKKMIELEEKECWFQFSFYPLWSGTEIVSQVLFISEDVSDTFFKEKKFTQLQKERIEKEEYLKKSEDKWHSLVESSPDIIFTLDKSFNITYMNFSIANARLQDMIGSNYLKYIQSEDLPNVTKYLKDCLIKGIIKEFEIKATVKGELTSWYSTRIAPIRNNITNEIEAIIAVSSDITTRKQIESETITSLKEKEILLKEIHHRVKNNLQIISSLLSLQSKQIKEAKIIEIFQTNISRVKSIALLHDMLKLSLNQSDINFKEYLNLISHYLIMIYQTKSNEVKVNIISEDIIISIDLAIYMGLIVNELISNSLKYAFPDKRYGIINVEAKWNAENIVFLKVSDNGIGLPADFGIDNVSTLGLKLVNMLTRQVNGTVEIEKNSELAFIFLFPVHLEKSRGK